MHHLLHDVKCIDKTSARLIYDIIRRSTQAQYLRCGSSSWLHAVHLMHIWIINGPSQRMEVVDGLAGTPQLGMVAVEPRVNDADG